MKDKWVMDETQLRNILAAKNLIPGLAHRLTNHLTPVIGYAQLLLPKMTDPEAREDLKKIIDETQQASQILRDLMSFLKRTKPEKEALDINDLIEAVLETKSSELTVKRIDVLKELVPSIPLTLADPKQLKQVIFDLINNAEEAISEFHGFGKIMVETHVVQDQIEIIISDDGPGISEEYLSRVFDPFFTTKRKGDGLGLTIAYDILTQHDGTMKVESEWGKGTTFILNLPILEIEDGKKKETNKHLDKTIPKNQR